MVFLIFLIQLYLSFDCIVIINFFFISQLKNSVIGSNKQKGNAIQQGVIPRLTQLLGDYEQPIDIRNETVIILGSLAKGTEDHIKELIKSDIVPLLLNCKLYFT